MEFFSDSPSYPKIQYDFFRNVRKGLIGSLTIACDTMIQEKMARQMYAKNREKIIQHARNARRGYFIVNLYNNDGSSLFRVDNLHLTPKC
jgi:hypothetical protein